MTALTLMATLAHPDDESFPIGGTLAKAAVAGKQVHLVVATRGEAGIPHKSAEETAVLREAELRRACAELGVQQLTFLDYLDGELANIQADGNFYERNYHPTSGQLPPQSESAGLPGRKSGCVQAH